MAANLIIKQVLLRRGNTSAASSYTGPVGEVIVDTGLDTLRVQDGVTAGGHRLATYAEFSNLAGGITSFANVIPSANVTYNLGSPTNWWNGVYTNNTIHIGGIPVNVNSNGNLAVNGKTISGNTSIVVSNTAPTITNVGTLWYNTNSGRSYIYYDNYWVDFSPSIAGPDSISNTDRLINGNFQVTIDESGDIHYPGDITQSSQDSTSCPAGADTVVYTATGQWQHAVKLFVMVEGTPDGGTSWETQACDVIAVRGYVDNIVHVTAYGVTYSSAAAFATFDGRWNSTTSRMEITCRPVSATNGVQASVHAIEMTSND